jgi:hypothetical protein
MDILELMALWMYLFGLILLSIMFLKVCYVIWQHYQTRSMRRRDAIAAIKQARTPKEVDKAMELVDLTPRPGVLPLQNNHRFEGTYSRSEIQE